MLENNFLPMEMTGMMVEREMEVVIFRWRMAVMIENQYVDKN